MKLARFNRPELWNLSTQDPFTAFRDELNRLFAGPVFEPSLDALNHWAPAVDVYEDNESVIVQAELPGLKKEEIDIHLHENTLTVAGERKHESKTETATVSRSERYFGRFQRSVGLPKAVDSSKVKASYKDGLLVITLPKAEEARPRQIQVHA